MALYEKYVNGKFAFYADFARNFKLNTPEDFNFGYDVVDVLGREKPDLEALLWTNLEGEVKHFSFRDISILSDKAAKVFQEHGI